MKLIALRDFRNIGGAIEIKDALHDLHIHKGAIFEIGKGDDLAVMKRASSGMFWWFFIGWDRGLIHPGGRRYPS